VIVKCDHHLGDIWVKPLSLEINRHQFEWKIFLFGFQIKLLAIDNPNPPNELSELIFLNIGLITSLCFSL